MDIKLGTLNMGRGLKHLSKSLEFLVNCDWEIACLQDLREDHLPHILMPRAEAKYTQF